MQKTNNFKRNKEKKEKKKIYIYTHTHMHLKKEKRNTGKINPKQMKMISSKRENRNRIKVIWMRVRLLRIPFYTVLTCIQKEN